jgi:hypothetical protein
MASVLHLLKGVETALAGTMIEQHARAGERITVVLLPGGAAPTLPAGVQVRRLPADLSYAQLVDLVFESDHVITW